MGGGGEATPPGVVLHAATKEQIPGGAFSVRSIKQTKRDKGVRMVQQLEGLGIKDLSLRFGVSSRTIHRSLARTRLRPH